MVVDVWSHRQPTVCLLTEVYLPIITDNQVTTVAGAVYTATVDTPGNNYTGSPAGVVNQLPHYFCRVDGDGNGAVAKVSVANGVTKIVRPGSGYTSAHVDFHAGHVYQSLGDLDADINGLDPLGDGSFASTTIIGPPGGFGKDLIRELGASHVGVFSTLTYNLFDFTQNVTFRQVGIIQDPELTVPGSDTATVCMAVTG